MSAAARAWLLGSCALAAIGLTFSRQPVALALPDPGWFGLPTSEHSFAWLRSVAGVVVLNLAAWGAGRLALRWLPSTSQATAVPTTINRMANNRDAFIVIFGYRLGSILNSVLNR